MNIPCAQFLSFILSLKWNLLSYTSISVNEHTNTWSGDHLVSRFANFSNLLLSYAHVCVSAFIVVTFEVHLCPLH